MKVGVLLCGAYLAVESPLADPGEVETTKFAEPNPRSLVSGLGRTDCGVVVAQLLPLPFDVEIRLVLPLAFFV